MATPSNPIPDPLAEALRENRELRSSLAQLQSEFQQFFYAANHDLQEPLRTVLAYAQLLDRQVASDPVAREYSAFLLSGANHMKDWPVDRNEWGMTPPTVNAYYNPTENNINFPAGILQPPFYSNEARDSVNYGAVGSVIGHELTHGFDDEGRQFDGDGNLKDWWLKSDREHFVKLSDCFVNQYGGYSPVSGVELNGKLTLGENTADNGGTRLAYLALLDVLAKKSISLAETQDAYTQKQQFFLGFAQSWCENQRPEAARLQVQTDPHSPAKFRVDGTVSNMPEFTQAFSCKAPDKMFTAKACRVW
jgi:putative endopeptidase